MSNSRIKGPKEMAQKWKNGLVFSAYSLFGLYVNAALNPDKNTHKQHNKFLRWSLLRTPQPLDNDMGSQWLSLRYEYS